MTYLLRKTKVRNLQICGHFSLVFIHFLSLKTGTRERVGRGEIGTFHFPVYLQVFTATRLGPVKSRRLGLHQGPSCGWPGQKHSPSRGSLQKAGSETEKWELKLSCGISVFQVVVYLAAQQLNQKTQNLKLALLPSCVSSHLFIPCMWKREGPSQRQKERWR